MSWEVREGDCVEAMAAMDEASVDAICTDPPYLLNFMGRAFDSQDGAHGDPKRMQEWHERWAREALRVLKPGGHLLAAGSSRTFHRLVAAVEDAGFEIRDTITHHVGSGFPKSLNVSEALRRLPACTCDVVDEVGAVDAAFPAGTVGAGVGAEARAVPLTGSAADLAGGEGSDVGTNAAGARADVQGLGEQPIGDDPPVVLGAGTVAGVAASDEVDPDVRGVKVDPEPLRDEVVGDAGNAPAVDARGVSDDLGGDGVPADPFVLPLPAAPGGVPLASETTAVGNRHAGARTVDGRALPVAGGGPSALGASECGWHDLKCDRCGGVRRDVPAGLGTALKPATEFWTVARKPLSGTVAQTVLQHGTGALNIDGCRVGFTSPDDEAESKDKNRHEDFGSGARDNAVYGADNRARGESGNYDPPGRWPANVVLGHSDGCVQVGVRRVATGTAVGRNRDPELVSNEVYGARAKDTSVSGYADEDGLETVERWACVPGCPVRALDAQTGDRRSAGNYAKGAGEQGDKAGAASIPIDGLTSATYADQGGASRFFYCAKAGRGERNAGLQGFAANHTPDSGYGSIQQPKLDRQSPRENWEPHPVANGHPTVKPIALMRWLVRLVTPPGGTVLDPFTGSGTTGCAAVLEGVDFIGVERESEYVKIAEARIRFWAEQPPGLEPEVAIAAAARRAGVAESGQGSLL